MLFVERQEYQLNRSEWIVLRTVLTITSHGGRATGLRIRAKCVDKGGKRSISKPGMYKAIKGLKRVNFLLEKGIRGPSRDTLIKHYELNRIALQENHLIDEITRRRRWPKRPGEL